MNNQEIAKKILNALELQKFADWYNAGNFDHWISGDLPTISDEQILEEIKEIFQLKD
jgi:hypothetical protein